ncbi:hypothetical protein [Microvirga makkahensis]|uniref:hypothetical protein n=1 Tax=Microvirga makkahensis TaxID=1128670 RepID=UPI001478EC13
MAAGAGEGAGLARASRQLDTAGLAVGRHLVLCRRCWIEPSFITSATETGASSVQRGKLTKMRPSCETATPVT